MSAGPAAVVVSGPPADEVQRVLLERAVAWARGLGADFRAQGAAEGAGVAFGAGHEPVLLVAPATAALSPAHATAALDDLSHGCELTIGPLMAGGWYLLGLARPLPELTDLPTDLARTPDVTGAAVAAAQRAGLTIGLLRPERGLKTVADRRAALVDPLLPEDLRAVLESN